MIRMSSDLTWHIKIIPTGAYGLFFAGEFFQCPDQLFDMFLAIVEMNRYADQALAEGEQDIFAGQFVEQFFGVVAGKAYDRGSVLRPDTALKRIEIIGLQIFDEHIAEVQVVLMDIFHAH